MKRLYKSWKLIISILIIIVAIIIVNYKDRYEEIRESNSHILNEVKENYLDTKEEREVGIEKLLKLLNKGRYLSEDDKMIIINHLALMYLANSDYQNGIKYSIETIHSSRKTKNNYIVANNMLNLTNTFIDLEGYETAEEVIKYVLSLDIEDEEQRNRIKEHAYINLADIYSKVQRENEALELISESLNYNREEDSNYNEKLLVRDIISARAFFYIGNIEKSDELLKNIDGKVNRNDKSNITNITIPYFAVKAKVEFYKGNSEEGIKLAEELFKLCDDENKRDIKISHMGYILGVLRKCNFENSNEIINEYKDKLLNEYEKLIRLKNKESVFFIINSYDSELEILDSKDKKINLYRNIAIATIVISIVFFILGKRIKNIRIESDIDGLTNIFNRKKFDYEYKRAKLCGIEFGVIVIDIDHFKYINDNYGHSFGDVVLKNISKVMDNRLSKDDMIFRYGGEEFCVICKNKSLDEVIFLAEVIREEVAEATWEEEITITISSGVAYTGQGKDLFKVADERLYKSKESGRNKVTYE